MQTKSEMINLIAELAQENAELKQEVKQWKDEYEILDACIELEQGKMSELKEEIEIRDNLSEKFRKEALSWANIANEYQKDKTKLEKTLQEIKAIVCGNYDIIDPQGRKDILKLINKTEIK